MVIRDTLLALSLALLFAASSAHAQTGGLVYAVQPCSVVYGITLLPNTPAAMEVREYCNVPANATAVFLNLKAWASGSLSTGKIYIWAHGASFPVVSQFNYQFTAATPQSMHVLVQLGPGSDEEDVSVQATTQVYFAASVEGYVAPPA